MAVDQVRGVLNFVLSKYVSTERYREGMKTGTRASFHMDLPDLAVLLQYIVDKQGCTPEEAKDQFVNVRDDAVRMKAKSPKDMGAIGGFFVSAVIAFAVAGLSSLLVGDGIWSTVVLSVIAAIVFVIMAFLFCWSPRRRAMEAAWSDYAELGEKLEKLHTIQGLSLGQLIKEHQRKQCIVFVIVSLLLVAGLPFVLGKDANVKQKFHNEMASVTVSADNHGTRYVVYNADQKIYVDQYLSDQHQALTADDVRGVFRISEGKNIVGRYEGQGNAYQRYVTIKLVDQRTGETVLTERVYGGDPPRSISVKAGSKNNDGYGSRPSTKDISDTINQMIMKYEAVY